MKNIIIICLPVLLFCACTDEKENGSKAEAFQEHGRVINAVNKNIYKSGDSMLAAFRRKDWATFVKYNHPAMIKMMGGEAAFASFIGQQMQQVPDTAIQKIELGKVLQVVKTNRDQQCLVEQNIEMMMEGIDLSRTTYLIGESLDNGNTWTFFDASTKTGVTAKQIKPDLSDSIKIPAIKR